MSQLCLIWFNFYYFLHAELEISESSECVYFISHVRKLPSFIRLFLFVFFIFQGLFVVLASLFSLFPFPRGMQGVGRTSTCKSLIFSWITELGVLCTLVPPSTV